jgi:hypothetical protein
MRATASPRGTPAWLVQAILASIYTWPTRSLEEAIDGHAKDHNGTNA